MQKRLVSSMLSFIMLVSLLFPVNGFALAQGNQDPVVPPQGSTPQQEGSRSLDRSILAPQTQPEVAGSQTPATLDAALKEKEGVIGIVIELKDAPAVVAYAEALQNGNSLQATTAGQTRLAQIEAAQQKLLAPLAAMDAKIVYRVQRVYNGIAVYVDANQLDKILELPGVLAVHPLITKYLDHTTSVPLIGAPTVWNATGLNATGEGIEVGVIDSGIDYMHTDFGGAGTAAAYTANDTTVITDTYNGQLLFPSAKVVGGHDFVGDDYDASGDNGSVIPVEDPDPAACLTGGESADHGTHVAGSVAGLGVKTDGTTYTGTYNSSINFTSTFRIGPGVAPKAKLYSLRVFGCNGSTDVTDAAIEWAVDPDGNGDFSDHLDVINMSLGSPYGGDYDSSAVASNNAALAGVVVVASAGNEADAFFVTGSPGSGSRVISVASSRDAGDMLDGIRVNSPASLAGLKPSSFSVAYNWLTTTLPITGMLVYPSTGITNNQRTGCYGFDITNTQLISGNVVLLDWTEPSCGGSVGRTSNAFKAGARGVIIVDNSVVFDLRITGSSVIPSVSAPKSLGDLLKAHLGENISISFNGSYASSVLLYEPSIADTLSAFSSRGPRRDGMLKPDITAPGDSIFSAGNGTGNQGLNYGGTSMAAPHVAGAMALLRQLHPTWTPEELKALVMNTALHDITIDPPASDLNFTPTHVGAGRIDLAKAGTNDVIAYNNNNQGLVSLSFGTPEVQRTGTFTQAFTIVNKGTVTRTYDLSYDIRQAMEGVSFMLSTNQVVVPAGGTATVVLTMDVDATKIYHTWDPTIAQDGWQHWLSEAAGYINLSPAMTYKTYLPIIIRNNTGTAQAAPMVAATAASVALRIPVYAAPRPTSNMHAVQTGLTFTGTTGSAALNMTGLELYNNSDDDILDNISVVSAYELQEVNPDDTYSMGDDNRADIQYIGVANDYMGTNSITNTTIYFAISTYGHRVTPNDAEFDIYIDVDRDSVYDFVLYNTDLGTATGADPSDEFVTVLYNLKTRTGTIVEDIFGLPTDNGINTAIYNSNLIVMPVPAARLGLTPAQPSFNYYVESYNNNELVDESAIYPFSAVRAGLDFSGGYPGLPIWYDLNGSPLTVNFSEAAYDADQGKGVLLFHHTNGLGNQVEIVTVTTANKISYVTLLHTNDFHGNLEAVGTGSSTPGVARMATVINYTRYVQDAGNVALFDAGDEMQGSLISNLNQGKPTIDLFNFLGYDAATFGNHEFDWGQTVLMSRTQEAGYPFLAANLVVSDSGSCTTAGWTSPSFTDPWMTMTVGTPDNEIILGIIGVTSQETPYITSASATDGLCFKDATESVLHYYDAVRAAGAQAIVILSHLGYTDGGYGYGIPVYGDQTLATRLAAAGKKADLIIGGHSHTNLQSTGARVISGTTIVQGYYSGRQVGRADMTYDKTSGNVSIKWQPLVIANTAIATNTAAAARLATWTNDPAYQALINQIIGFTKVDLVRNYNNGDNTMGAFINDALYNDLNNDGTTANDTDMVFNNAGGLRADITGASVTNPLTLTYGALFSVLPFGNQTIVGDMTGARIQELLNQSATLFKGSLQVSGIQFHFYVYTDTIGANQPWAWGAYSVTVKNRSTGLWEPLVMTKTYRVATNEFLAPAGQDGFTPFKYMTNISYWGDMLNGVNHWVSTAYSTTTSAYNAGLDGRVVQDTNIIPVTILHHNDPHGRLLDNTSGSTTYAGYSRLATLIKLERSHNPSRTLLINAGDTIQGDAMMAYYKAAFTGYGSDGMTLPVTMTTNPIIAAMNAMSYTAMVLGNHEFNYGNYIFTGTLRQATFPLLQANVYDTGTYGLAQANIKPSLIVTTADGIRIALLGIGNHRVPQYELPSNIPGLIFTNPITEAQARVPALEAAADAVVAVTHIGFTTNPNSVEVDTNVDTELAKQVSGIDAIIGSHSHTDPNAPDSPYKYLPTMVGNPDNDPVIINQAGRYNGYLGVVVLGLLPKAGGGYEVVATAGRSIANSLNVAEDTSIKSMITPYDAFLTTYRTRTLGMTYAPLDTTGAFTSETNGANLQADASVWKLRGQGLTIDFHLSGAMTNAKVNSSATLTNPVNMTINDMFSLMPYENSLLVIRMNGPQLKTVLERAYRNYWYYKYQDTANPRWGGYSHYTTCMLDISAGGMITYTDDPVTYTAGVDHVLGLSFGTTVVDFNNASTYYNVSTVNYLAAGSCNFNNSGVTLWPLSQTVADTQYYVRDVVIDYLPSHTPITPTVEGRLRFLTP